MTRASIYQGVQIGLETTRGTAVPADKQLLALSIEPSAKSEVKTYKPMGAKFTTIAMLNKEWSESKLSGPITYTDILYPLNSVLKTATPTGEGTAKTWAFAPVLSGADTVSTFTVEQGDAVQAVKLTYGIVTGLTLKFSKTGNELTGTMIGKALTTGITKTATPSAVELVPAMPTEVSYYLADTYAGLASATALGAVLSSEWSITDRFNPTWFQDGTATFATHVEKAPKLTVKLLMEADATGMGLLTTMRNAATKFLRIKVVGGAIGESDHYLLQIDTSLKVTDPDALSDQDGVYAIGWNMEGAYNATWGKTTEVTVVNKISAL